MHKEKEKKQSLQFDQVQRLQLDVDEELEEQLPQDDFVDQYDIENFI